MTNEQPPKPTGASDRVSVSLEEAFAVTIEMFKRMQSEKDAEIAALKAERNQALAERDALAFRFGSTYAQQLEKEIESLTAKNASLLDQLQWAHKNEKQYKDATQEALAENQKLKESYKHEVYTQLCAENQRLREALEFECGNRCAHQNPCNARLALESK